MAKQSPRPVSRRYIWLVSFTSGMCVMALEMTASRVVSPHFGTSISVWANVIGLILVALSVGYWFGGKWAERSPKLETLLKLLAAAAVLSALIPFLARPLAEGFIDSLSSLNGVTLVRLGSFLLVALLFFAPILLLGVTSPFVIKLLSTDERVGETSGRVFALSTIGSIIGTFVPAFWLVPTIGTRATVMLFAALLFAVVGFGLLGRRWGVLGLLPLGLTWWVSGLPIKSGEGQVAEVESAYQYVQVTEHAGVRSLRFDEGTMIQSQERASTPFTDNYWDALFVLPSLSPAPKPKVLILGFAVGTAARGMIELRPEGALDVTGVELDPAVLDLGRRYFSVARLEPRMRLVVEDARAFLERSREQYDFILLDCYANQRYIPTHLVTQEFFTLVREHLAPGGFLVANVNAPVGDSVLLRSFDRTLKSVFTEVERLDVPHRWNREIVAAAGPLDWAGTMDRLPPVLKPYWTQMLNWRTAAEDETGLLLTDDRAPVELLVDAQTFAASAHK